MTSNAPEKAYGQSDFLVNKNRVFCSVLGSLFDHFLTKFWSTRGNLYGCLLEPSQISWASLKRPLDPKTLKNCRFLRFLNKHLFKALKLLVALWGSPNPFFDQFDPKTDPQIIPKIAQKWVQKSSIFLFFFGRNSFYAKIRSGRSQKWDTKWTRVFAQKPKRNYKRNQDEPKRDITCFKELNTSL